MKTSFWERVTIIPRDAQGRIYLFLSILFVSFIYLWRVVRADFFIGYTGILLGTFFWLCPAFCLLPFFVYLIGLCNYVLRLHGHLSPLLFLVGGFLLARSLAVPATPEEIIFSLQKSKYEQIVELARNDQLQQSDACQEKNLFVPPSGFLQWSNACIYVGHNNGIVVEFALRNWERPIVYLENPTSESYAHSMCESIHDRRDIREGFVFKQISKHWFICKRWIDF